MSFKVAVLLVCVCLIGSNGLILSPVLAAIATDFDASVSDVSRAISGYGFAAAVSALFLGRYIQAIGYLRVLVIAITVAGTAQLLSSLSLGWLSLTVYQSLAGVATGVALPSIYALTAQIAKQGEEAKTLGIVVFGWSLALIVAIPSGTFVAYHFGWRLMLVFLGSALLCSLVSLFAFKDLESSAKRSSTNKSAIFTPLTYAGAIKIYLICGLFMTSFYGLYAFTGVHAVEGFKQTIAQAGYIGLMYGIGFGLGSINAGRLDRVNKHHALSINLCCGASALIACAFTVNFWLFLVIFSLMGVANSLVVNLIVMRVGALSEVAKGASLSLYTTISYIGVTVGTLGFGLVYEHNGFKWMTLFAAGFYILAIILNNLRQKSTI